MTATTTVTFTVGVAQARFLIMLAPRAWDPGVATFEPLGDSGRRVRVTMDLDTARAAAAQLTARGDHKTAVRVMLEVSDAVRHGTNPHIAPAQSVRARHDDAVRIADRERRANGDGRTGCPHPFRDGCPDGPWTCFTCGHVEPGTCASDHGPASR